MEEQIVEKKRPTFLESMMDFLEVAVFALVLVAVLFAFFIRIVGVDGPSMNDTLQHGDHLILTKAFYTPEHGDIVVFNYNDRRLIKRVIAVEGDRIEVDSLTNIVKLNGVPLVEPYVSDEYPNIPGTEGEIIVPEGCVFVMGDHRNNSTDSRKIGCVSTDDIIGKAVWRFLPLDSFGGIYDNMTFEGS